MKYEITREQLRSLTDPKVKEMFPDAFKVELEIGKWYKSEHGNLVFNNGKFGEKETYGFGYVTMYFLDKITFRKPLEWQLATNQEVSEALINEAKTRGYKKGVICKFRSIKEARKIGSDKYFFDKESLFLGRNAIFYKGIWAEIIEEPTFEYLEEVEVSYRADYWPSSIFRYGCKSPDGSHICFDKYSSAPLKFKYIKKIKL